MKTREKFVKQIKRTTKIIAITALSINGIIAMPVLGNNVSMMAATAPQYTPPKTVIPATSAVTKVGFVIRTLDGRFVNSLDLGAKGKYIAHTDGTLEVDLRNTDADTVIWENTGNTTTPSFYAFAAGKVTSQKSYTTVPLYLVSYRTLVNGVYKYEKIFTTSTQQYTIPAQPEKTVIKEEYRPYGDAIYNLFADSGFTTLKPGVTQDSIDDIIINMIPPTTDPAETARLEDLLSKAQELLNSNGQYKEAQDKVGALTNPDKTVLTPGVGQTQINDAKDTVNKLPAGPIKDGLLADVNNAQNLFDQKIQAIKDKQDAQNKVGNLLTPDKTALLPGVGQAQIDAAQDAVNKLPAGTEKDALQKDVDKAKELLAADNLLNDAKNKVGNLLTPDKTALLPGVGQSQIDNAQNAVNKLPAGPVKDGLQADINKAQDLLNAQNNLNNAKDKVGNLLTPGKDALLPGVEQAQIDSAQNAVNKVPNGPVKDGLQADIDKAQDLLNKKGQAVVELTDAENKVGALLTPDKTDLLPGVGQTQIDNAQNAVNKVPAGPVKDGLQADVNKAQDLLNKKNQAAADLKDAQDKVGALLTPDKNNLLPGVDQAQVDAAQNAVNKLPAGPVKDALQADVTKAQELLNKKNQAAADVKEAQDKVGALLTPDKNALLPGIGQAQIDAAQNAVNKLPAGPIKDGLQADVTKAQELLNKKNQAAADLKDAQNKVGALLIPDKTDLLDGIGQAQIDEAQNAVNKLPAGPTKDALQADVTKAKEILANRIDAENKVGALLTPDKNNLANGVNQTQINAAQQAVNKLPMGPHRDGLQADINKAQNLLNAKIDADKKEQDAKDKVGNLLTPDKNGLLPGVGQTQVDEAQNAVDKLPAGPVKEGLQAEVDKAQELVNKKDQEAANVKDAQDKVGALLTPDKNNLLPGVGQAQIDAAQNAVNKLPAGPTKDGLQADVTKAQELLNKKNQAAADLKDAQNKVGALLTPDKTDLLDGIGQAQIDEAQNAVNKLPAGPTKDALQADVTKAKELLANRIDAENKVGALLTPDKNNIANGVNQAQINAAQQAVNKLPMGPLRDKLQADINKAQILLNEKAAADKIKEEAKNAVDSLLTPAKDDVKPNVGQAQIDAAQNAVNKLPAGTDKDNMQAEIAIAQKIVDAEKAVNALVDKSGVILPSVTDKEINDAQNMINALPNGAAKDRLQAKLNQIKAQKQNNSTVTITSIEPIGEGETTVSGIASKNTKRVYIYHNGILIRWRPVDATTGAFLGFVSSTLRAGDTITLVPEDANGKRGTAMDVKVSTSLLAEMPTIQQIKDNDIYMNGTSGANTAYVRIYVNGTYVRRRNVEADGKTLTGYILDFKLKVGDVVTVVPYTSKDRAGKEAKIIVQSSTFIIKDYVEGEELLFGQTTPLADKVDIYVDGVLMRTRVLDKTTGEFYTSMRNAAKELPKAGAVIKIVARTDKGIVYASGETVVQAKGAVNPSVVNTFAQGMTHITGTTNGAVKMRVYYGDNLSKVTNRGTITNGVFSIYAGDLNLKTGDTIRVVGINDNGREVSSSTITVQ